MQRTMYDSGYQGDRHTLPRPGMVTSLHDTSSPTSLVVSACMVSDNKCKL